MLKILKQPKWIILTIILIIAIYAFINLSEWQFNRNDQRRALNQEITSALNKDQINILQVQDLNNLVEWQTVGITGKIETENVKFARNRYLDSSLGFWVIAPFKSGENQKVLINLGFLPVNYQDRFDEISLPGQTIELKGWIRKIEKHKNTPSDYPELQISSISSENFMGEINKKYYIQINESSIDLEPISYLPKPKLSSGPHFSYAIQWIIFAILLPVGWVILYRSEKN